MPRFHNLQLSITAKRGEKTYFLEHSTIRLFQKVQNFDTITLSDLIKTNISNYIVTVFITQRKM